MVEMKRLPAVAALAATIAALISAAAGSGFSYEFEKYDPDTLFQPRFASEAASHTVKRGGTVTLPCVVRDLGAMVVMWKKQDRVLTVRNEVVRDLSRLRLLDGFNLQISQARPTDADVYTCTVALDDRDLEQTQTLEVHYGPTVKTIPESLITVEQGQNASLQCRARGNPKPRVHWRKRVYGTVHGGASAVELQHSERLHLTAVTRSDGGLYQCVAENDLGDTATADVSLQVLYRPEVEVERSTVHTGEGFDVQLVCIVHADPIAEVKWKRANSPIDYNRAILSNDVIIGTRHVLTISDVSLNDFDTYTCTAENDLGDSHGKILVSGVADKVKVVSTPMNGDAETFDLAWKVKSFSPVLEYKIAYRKTKMNLTSQSPGRWKEVLVPTTGRQAQNDIYFHQQVTLRGLTPAAAYELHIQAKNKHGWNRVSDTFHFSTIGRALESRSLANSRSSRIALYVHLYFILVGVAIRSAL